MSSEVVDDYRDDIALVMRLLNGYELPLSLSQKRRRFLEQLSRRFLLIQGVLYRKTTGGLRRVLHENEMDAIFAELHDNLGHFSGQTLFQLARERFWWPGSMLNTCRRFVASCEACLKFKKPLPQTAPLPIETSGIFQRWSFDFVGPIRPRTKKGNTQIIVAIEHLTNWPIAKAVPDVTAQTLVQFILSEIVTVFGCPYQLLSDGGRQMRSALYQDILRLLRISRELTTIYHPQGNGKCERFNGTLISELRKLCTEEEQWDEVLDLALFAYRVRPGKKGLSPFRLLYGVDPR